MEPNNKKRKLESSSVLEKSTSSFVQLPSEIILSIFDYYEFPLGRHVNFISVEKDMIESYLSRQPAVMETIRNKKKEINYRDICQVYKIIRLLTTDRMIKLLYGSFKNKSTDSQRETTLLFKHVSLVGFASVVECPVILTKGLKSLRISPQARSLTELQDIVEQFPVLERASTFLLDDNSFEEPKDYQFPNLRELSCRIENIDTDILGYFPNLTSLSVDLGEFDFSEFEFNVCESLKFLKTVQITMCPKLKYVKDMIQSLEFLEKLDVSFDIDGNMDKLFSNLERTLKITSLKFSKVEYSDKFFSNINGVAKYLPKLESFDIIKCEIKDDKKSTPSVKEFLKKFPKLKQLMVNLPSDSKFKKIQHLEYLAIGEDVKNPIVEYPKRVMLLGSIVEGKNWLNVCEFETHELYFNIKYIINKSVFPNLKKLKIVSENTLLEELEQETFDELIAKRPDIELSVSITYPKPGLFESVLKCTQVKQIRFTINCSEFNSSSFKIISSSQCSHLQLNLDNLNLGTSSILMEAITANKFLEYIKINVIRVSSCNEAVYKNLQLILENSTAADIDINGDCASGKFDK